MNITQGQPRFDFRADSTLEIDDVPGQRQETSCQPATTQQARLCSGTVYIPSLRVSFRAESSTSVAVVDQLLDGIRILPNQVAVPGFTDLGGSPREAKDVYLGRLSDLGLASDVLTKQEPTATPGYVLDVAPDPGTMLNPDDIVTVTVAAN